MFTGTTPTRYEAPPAGGASRENGPVLVHKAEMETGHHNDDDSREKHADDHAPEQGPRPVAVADLGENHLGPSENKNARPRMRTGVDGIRDEGAPCRTLRPRADSTTQGAQQHPRRYPLLA